MILDDISVTSNRNFDRINKKFHNVNSAESALARSVQDLAQNMQGQMSDAQNLEKAIITVQMANFLTTQQTIYLASL